MNDLQMLYKVRKNIIAILVDRGYDISIEASKLSYDNFMILFEKDEHNIYIKNTTVDNKKEYIYVYFETSDDFTKKILESRLQVVSKKYKLIDKLLIVLKTYGHTKKKTRFKSFIQSPHENIKEIEILDNIFPFDIAKNCVFPTCFILTESEKKDIVEKYKTELIKFPQIKFEDPLCTRYGAKEGDLIFIQRNEKATFRYVVP